MILQSFISPCNVDSFRRKIRGMPLGELCVLGQAVSDEIARQRAMPPLPPGCLAADGERDTVVVPGASPGGSIYVSLAWTCG